MALRLGLEHVRRRWPGPVALVEVGASAGLNRPAPDRPHQANGPGMAGGVHLAAGRC
ncbi:hypothetical protein [Actinospica robiniae]|uniref:hypothetical protein n=1 Tax=Actinospica robiniae TaxID=304901 RepID=UPI0012FC5F09